MDVEGGELGVLESLLPLMLARRLRHLVVEITPGWWDGKPGAGYEQRPSSPLALLPSLPAC